MDDPACVPLCEGIRNLHPEVERMPAVHRAGGHLLPERIPLHELVGQIEAAVMMADVEEGCDIRMRQFRGRTGVLDQAAATMAFGKPWRSQLEGNCASHLRVPRAVHLAEPSLANALEQVVMRDCAELFAHPFTGREGLSSTRLGRLRGFISRRSNTTWPTSSGWIFQAAFPASPRPLNPVATDPGST